SIDTDTIVAQLDHILTAENIQADPAVVRRVARLATGSMRDALSLLDQLLAFGGPKLDEDLLEQVLPTPHNEHILQLVDQLGSQDPAAALVCVEKCLGAGQTAERFCESLLEHLRTLMLLAVCGHETDLIDAPASLREQLAKQASRFDAPTYVYMISLLQELRRSVKFASAGRALVDAAVVRLALAEQFTDLKTLLGAVAGTAASPSVQKPVTPAASANRSQTGATGNRTQKRPSPPKTDPPPAKPASKKTSATSKVSPQARKKIMADPNVKRAMELFDGSIVDIQPQADTATRSDTPDEPAAKPT
ncbi:MAG: hypothetical protein ACE5GE_13630, partial [Phycisphaerae bacterium]